MTSDNTEAADAPDAEPLRPDEDVPGWPMTKGSHARRKPPSDAQLFPYFLDPTRYGR